MSYATSALSVRIADELAEMIANGEFRPGDKLPNEPELSRRMQVSRTTLREALRILSTRGLVEVRRGIGTFVTQSRNIHADYDVLKIQDTNVNTKDLYEMRLMFEPQAAYYACLRASDEELETIFRYGELNERMIRIRTRSGTTASRSSTTRSPPRRTTRSSRRCCRSSTARSITASSLRRKRRRSPK